MPGILLVDKPLDWTSFDVVHYVRKIFARAEGVKPKNLKVGHIGTLDPLATGLLVVLVGKEYTKQATQLSKLDKTYEVTMKLGINSTTGDEEGEKTAVSDMEPSLATVEAVLQGFVGEGMQTPPAYSAVKVGGQRAYKMAREGKTVTLEPRPVTIYAIQLTSYQYPLVTFTVEVSSGTYIRSLVSDIGVLLKTGAYLTALRRTLVGRFRIQDATPVSDISTNSLH
jgi:tRNA pseudouridine55 synthase